MDVVDVRICFFLDTISDWADVGRRFFRAPLVEINGYMYESRMFLIFLWFFTRRKKGKKILFASLWWDVWCKFFWGGRTFAFYSPRLLAADVLDWDLTAILWCWDGRSVCCPDRITRTVTRKHRHTFNLCWLVGWLIFFFPLKASSSSSSKFWCFVLSAPNCCSLKLRSGFDLIFSFFPAKRFSFFSFKSSGCRPLHTNCDTYNGKKSITDTESTAVYTHNSTQIAQQTAMERQQRSRWRSFSFEFPALNRTESNSARQFRFCQPDEFQLEPIELACIIV